MRAVLKVRRVQRERVGQQRRADHLGDERLPDRGLDRVGDTEQDREAEDVPELHQVGDHEHRTSPTREDGPEGVGDQQQDALVVPVGEPSGEEAQQQHRGELQGGDDPERARGVVGEFEYQPVLRDEHHPDADHLDQLSGGEEPVVANRQGLEDGPELCLHLGVRLLGSYGRLGRRDGPGPSHRRSASTTRCRISAALRSVSRSAAVSSASRSASQLSRARSNRSRTSCRPGRRGEDDLPAVGRMGRAADEAALLQLRDDPGHRWRSDPFRVGEFPWRQRAGQLEAGQCRQLRHGQVADRTGLPDPPAEAGERAAQPARQLRGRHLLDRGRPFRHVVQPN